MTIDWTLAARIAGPLLAAGLGWFLKAYSDRGSNLIVHYGHVSDFLFEATATSKALSPRMHSVVVRNVGRRKASNVRITHSTLPNFHIFPAVRYRVEDLSDGGKQIVLDSIVPDEQLTINYMYFPPLVFNQVVTRVISDDGYARVLNVSLVPIQPAIRRWSERALMWSGGAALLYVAIEGVIWAWRHFST